jgi:hypothetical protein
MRTLHIKALSYRSVSIILIAFSQLASLSQAAPLDLDLEILNAKAELLSLQRSGPASAAANLSRKHLTALETLRKSQTTLDSDSKVQIFAAIEDLDQTFQTDIPVSSTLQLIQYISTYGQSWQTGTPPEPKVIAGQSGQAYNVEFEVDENREVYAIYGNALLGKGASKLATRVIRVRDWLPLARLSLRLGNDPKEQKKFTKEKNVLKSIASLPSASRVGLADTIHIGKYVYQKKYDSELFDVLNGSVSNIPFDNRLEMIQKLSSAVITMHHLHYIVADIKPANIFVQISKNPKAPITDIVLSDFGLSYNPATYLQANLPHPFCGTPLYAAPEIGSGSSIGDKGWFGKNTAEKLENAYKTDVFSLVTVIYSIFHLNEREPHLPWMTDSEIGAYERNENWPMFYQILEGAMRQFAHDFKDRHDRKKTIPMDDLIQEGLEMDPVKRISSEKFNQKLIRVISDLKAQNAR